MSGSGSEPREHHLPVTRTARYWTAGDPDAPSVWVVLHGYKQLARRFLRRFEHLAGPDVLVVAPEALSRFYVSQEPGRHGPESVVGATWMTKEDRLREIDDYVAYLDRLVEALNVGARGLTVVGFSQGVATAARWVVHGAVQPDRLLLWGDSSPPDLDLERARTALRDVETVLVRGDRDRAFDEARVAAEAARLDGAGIVYRVVTYAGGHDIDPSTRAAPSAIPARSASTGEAESRFPIRCSCPVPNG